MPFDPDAYDWPLDERGYARTLELARELRPYFRPRWFGFERLRGERGMIIAANHGLFGHELLPLLLGAHEVAHRTLRTLSDRVLFATALQRRLLRPVGSCQGTPAVAHKLLTRGELVYTCPGGAREALAPATERYQLSWEGHTGFVRSAIRAGAPIVPMAIIGIDETYREVVSRDEVRASPLGALILRWFGEKYLTPIHLGVGLAPLPQQLTFHCGVPIEVPGDPSLADDPRTVARLHERARRATEALIAHGLREREEHLATLPWRERLANELLLRFAAGGAGVARGEAPAPQRRATGKRPRAPARRPRKRRTKRVG